MATLRLPIFVLLCACASQAWPRASSPERHVVYPLRADAAGHVISADVTSHYHGGAGEGGREGGEGGGRRSGRVKRDSANGTSEGDPRENLYIVINNENEELFLNLTPNTKLVTQHTVIEWVLEDGRRILRKATGDCFYVGRLRSTEKSLVAISNCNGLTGYIQTHNDSYFIEPLRNQGGGRGGGEGAEDGGGGGGGGADHPQPHLIYKVKSITSRLNLSLQQDQEFRQHEGDEDEDEEEEEEEEDDEEEEEEDEEELAEEERRTPGEKGGLRQTQGKRRGETGGERDFWKGTTLEMPKFRRHHHHRHREQRPVVEEEATFPEEEPTFPEFLDFLARTRRRRSSVFGASLSQDLETMRSTLQRAKSLKKAFIPKFRRRPEEVDRVTTRPKFVRPRSEVREPASSSSSFPSTSDRIGRSTPTRPPKFDQRYRPTFHDSDRAKREDNEGGRETERRENETEEEEGRENEESEGDGEERRDRKRRKKDRKKKKNRKRCKVQESESGSENQTNETETDETSNKEGRCRERKKLTKEERQRRKEERRERRRLEREKKLREKEKKKKERRERRRKKNRKMMNDSMTATFPQAHTNVGDPFDGEDWQGYSPDVFWETPVAEGSSGLAEVSLGPALNTTDPPKWLELVVAVDHTVIEFHGEDEVEKYVFTLFNIVSAIYEDPSLESSLELVMLRIIFYKDKKHSQVREGLAKKSLEAVNRWSERLYRLSHEHLRHDMAVWLTRTDLGGPSGYAPVAGVCEPSRSCTLNRDEGLTSAFIIAHEMGHVLGLSHDGDPVARNDCENEGFQGSVMAPLVAATFSRFHWSKCSKREYHTRAGHWSCMLNKPQWKNATTVSSTIQYQYSLDDQCRMEFGEGFGLCQLVGMNDPCTHLWCSNSSAPHLCKTKKGPPLEGTICGDQKWCRHGFCESMSQRVEGVGEESPVRHNPQDGGLGPWSRWGPCSRTCGTGVAFRTRKCDSPPPAWGGRSCRGKREEWKVCGTEECQLPRHDFRAQQCRLLTRIVKLDRRRSGLTWLPYEPKSKRKKCRISCYSRSTNEVYIGREFVVDGTPCSYDEPHDICVQGKCVALGCDSVIGSKAKEDECGVCNGDGATCTRHNLVYDQVPSADYSLVATLPAGARNILIQEEIATSHFLALGQDNNNSVTNIFFLNGDRTQEPPMTFVCKGAKFNYSSEEEREILTARGPLLRPVAVMVHGSGSPERLRVTTSYVTRPREEHYQWEAGPYTACSVSCGGGQQHQTLVCRDRRSDLQVFHDRCAHLPRPKLNATDCNTFGCEARWVTGPWEHCSTTCGPHGVQEREVACVTLPQAESANWTSGVVDPERCSEHPMPEAVRECMRAPCPAHWMPVEWGQCSTTCGPGTQAMTWECVGGGGNEVTYDCGTQPHQVRECPEPPPCPPPPCQSDASEFCQLPVLHRYCKVPKYRELCCHTCGNLLH